MKEIFKTEINRVAETQFSIRPQLVLALKKSLLTDTARKVTKSTYQNYFDMWTGSFSDKFFDMGTIIRLGSVIEGCLKQYYMNKKGYTNILQLRTDPKYKQGIFQRIQDPTGGVIKLFIDELNFDLTIITELKLIQEAMQHRHLYAHNSGIIDDDYIAKILKITGIDLLQNPQILNVYPAQDVYWFKPLERINEFIEATRRFFAAFP